MQDVDTVRLMAWKEATTAQLLVAGIGGFGLEVADAAAQSERWRGIDFLHNDPPGQTKFGRWRVLGPLDRASELHPEYADGVVALPENTRRVSVARELLRLGYFVPCVVHPLGYITKSVRLDFGCVILAQAVVGPDSVIGMASIVRAGSTIAANCSLGAGVMVGAGAHIGAGASVGNYAEIGMGAVIEEGVSVGSRVRVRAGAVVHRDLPDGVIAAGVPAMIEP